MINLDRIIFSETGDAMRPGCTKINGRLEIHCEISFDDQEVISRKVVEDHIRECIWREVYGELFNPLFELEDMALMHVPPTAYATKVRQLCDQLNALIKTPPAGPVAVCQCGSEYPHSTGTCSTPEIRV